ncbi:MAG: enoyl-CoA hydratase/isomerase family protein [Actinomycetota bacterium]
MTGDNGPPAPQWSLAQAEAVAASLDLAHEIGVPAGVSAVVFDVGEEDDPNRWAHVAARLAPLAVVTLARHPGWADASGEVDHLAAAVKRHPLAATITAQLLRRLPERADAAFQAESLAYATLQAGPEHRAWLDARGRRVRGDEAARVRIDDGDPVTITMTRPRLHNLLDARGRDELAAAFRTVALMEPETRVRWIADGPSFCAGGDPAEFGVVADPATAHTIRSSASPAPALAAIRGRVTAHVHGACVGAGIELAAQASVLIADPATRFRLPELTMGLTPGVGGCWSISRRIGRERLLTWLLTDAELDAETALAWGLIDAIQTR